MKDFVTDTSQTLNSFGFTPENSLSCVVSCRDELTRPLTRLIENVWGESFDLSALGGLFSAGKTGLKAALSHVPEIQEDELSRLVIFVFTHIGIRPDGTVGKIIRPHQTKPSSACGALCAFLNQLESGETDFLIDPHDREQGFLARRLNHAVNGIPDLMSLTRLTLNLSITDVKTTLDNLPCNYAIVGGIHIHHELKEDEVSEVSTLFRA